MPATRPRASFEPISPKFDLQKLVEATPNFHYVDRISCEMIDQQGLAAFEKLVLLHVIKGGKPLVIDGFEDRLDPWTFSPKWLRDNCGDKVEQARVLNAQENLPLTMGHYLKNMGKLTNQFFEKDGAYKEKNRQRVYLKDIDCPPVWQDKLKEHIPSMLFYLNDSTGDVDGPGAVPDPTSNVPARNQGKGIARAGDLMSSLPPDMRAENLMCYIGHEGTYTPAHREMCASLGQNIMVEASGNVSEDGRPERPGSSIWFMTESKDRHIVSEYWLGVLGHDIEVENHFAQVVAWKKAPFNVYVVEQKPGDFILIPPLAPHQVWNRGTRTMKVAWNRTTVETLEMALNEALPRSRIVCRDEQYKNKAIIYYTLQKYSSLLVLALQQAARMPAEAAQKFLYSGKIKQLIKDFKQLFNLYRQVMLSEMFNPEDRDAPKSIEFLSFDSNVTCAYCRGNIFNRFLSCPNCKDLLGHNADDADGDPYDVCMDCYAMGRSCGCISGLKWVEQFRWKELAGKYESWRKLIIQLDGGQVNDKSPLSLVEERKRYGKKTLAEVCKEQLKRRPFKDIKKPVENAKEDEDEDEEIIVGDDGMVKKIAKKPSKAYLKSHTPCHVCKVRHPNWKMAFCTTCDRAWCYGSLFRGWDKMPMELMEDPDWSCPHCLDICFAGVCRKDEKMQPYEPKGTLLGHDTKKVADVRSVEALVDFSVSNLNWLKDDNAGDRTNSNRVQRAKAEAARARELDPGEDEEAAAVDQTQVDYEYSPENNTPLDPALTGQEVARRENEDDDAYLARRLQLETSTLPPPAAMVAGAPANGALDGYAPVAPPAQMYPQPDANGSYPYPQYARPSSVQPEDRGSEEVDDITPFRKRAREDDEDEQDSISMQKRPKAKKPRMSGAGFKSTDLADGVTAAAKAKSEAMRQFEKEKERKALDKAKFEGRFIMMQAALRNKKRIVKLKIPGPRLAQLLAQQAAKAALGTGGEADAEHEVEEGAPRVESEDHGTDLLKSDIAPKKTKDSKAYYKQREEQGLVITAKTKKALIPVEKDDNYGYRARERLPNGKRVLIPEETRNRRRDRRAAVEYEEVDIGSEDDEEGDLFVPEASNTANATGNRRSLPGYLKNRHDDEDDDMPDELPKQPKRKKPAGSGRRPAATAQRKSGEDLPPDSPLPEGRGAAGSRTAGKRPSMRPALTNDNGHAEDKEAEAEVVPEEANTAGAAPSTSNGTPKNTRSPASRPTSSGRPRGRPPKAKPRTPLVQQALSSSEEQNRLAKMQLMADIDLGPTRPSAGQERASQGSVKPGGMADKISDEHSDDGVDEVPAGCGAPVRAH
jgi:hypothetical protein